MDQPTTAVGYRREGWREDGKVKKYTLANLSRWPQANQANIDALRRLLKNEPLVGPDEAFEIVGSRPHGHVDAVLGTLKRLRLDRLTAASASPRAPAGTGANRRAHSRSGSQLATARGLAEATARDTLAETLGISGTDEDDLYAAMDWLVGRQDGIEWRSAEQHLHDGAPVLYDLTSVYLEGRACPLAKRGHSRDGKRGKLQIEFGLLRDTEGRPVAVEVFDGNTTDPNDGGGSDREAAALLRSQAGSAGGRSGHVDRKGTTTDAATRCAPCR